MNIIDFVYYDETSPSCLRWKGCAYHVKDAIVGSKEYRKGGVPAAWRTRFKMNRYQVHRVIYEIFNGVIAEDMVIDHIDGNPFNNLIKNLREVTPRVNSRNSKKHKRNSTGKTGVCIVESRGIYFYRATYVSDTTDKLISKNFNINTLGESEAFRRACDFRDNGISHSKNYTERHGK